MRAFIGVVLFLTIASATASSDQSRALLSSAFITGSETYPVAAFAPMIGLHVGQPVSRQLIEQMSADIEALYRRDGYVVPQVFAADAELTSSTPRLHIFEAQIAEVAIRGNAGPYFDTIMAYSQILQSRNIHKQRSLNYLRKIEELPGLHLRATFEPRAGEPNRHTLVLNVSYEAVKASVSLHNRGTENLGRTMMGGRVTFNGLLGAQEAVTLTGAASTDMDKYHYAGARIGRRFGATDTTLDASSSRAEPDRNSRYSTDRLRVEARTTVFDDGSLRIEPLAGIAARNSEETNAEGRSFYRMRTRSIEAGLAARATSPGATTYLWTVLARGIDGLGASAFSLDGTPPDIEFTKGMIEIAHVRALSPGWLVRIDGDGQWSSGDLPAAERFTFGGAHFGRAFDPAALSGDSGAAMSFQLEHFRRWQNAWLSYGRVYAQADYGYARHNVTGYDDDAASITAGLGAKIAAMLTSLELSHPLRSPDYDEYADELRVFVLMQMNF